MIADSEPPADRPSESSRRAHECWTPARQELLGWLHRNAPSLAELYEGAVVMMLAEPLPGRVRFVAHAAREIRNRLPEVVSGVKSGPRFQDKNRLDDLARAWKAAGLAVDGSTPATAADAAEPSPTGRLLIDRRLFLEVAALLRDHLATRTKPGEAAARLFEAISPQNRGARERLAPVIQQWLSVTEWFVSKAHDSGDPDAACDSDELKGNFQLFEITLMALVRGFYSTVDELDAILEDTNS